MHAFHEVLGVGWADSFRAVILNNEDCTLVAHRAASDGLLGHLTELETCQAELVDGVAAGFEGVFGAELDALQVAAVDDRVLVILADVLQVHALPPRIVCCGIWEGGQPCQSKVSSLSAADVEGSALDVFDVPVLGCWC